MLAVKEITLPRALQTARQPRELFTNTSRMTQFRVVTSNVLAMNVAIKLVMSLFASRRTTGFMMGTCDDVPHTVPVLLTNVPLNP